MAGVNQSAAEFIFFPNRYIHESWRAGMLQEPVWAMLAACERVEGRLATFVSEQAHLTTPETLSLEQPQARFCLLPGASILKIAHRIGLVLNAARFGKLIDGKLVARLRRELGPEAYEFALRRAPLITSQTDPLPPDLAGEAPLGEALERSGINYIGLALRSVAPELRARFRLKLPKDHASLLDAPQGDTTPEAAWQVVRKVVREAEPQWSASLE